jgi:hypothetical protein
MKTGLMWSYDKKESLAEGIEGAIKYYMDWYATRPTICYVNPDALSMAERLPEIRIVGMRNILRWHIWVGIED